MATAALLTTATILTPVLTRKIDASPPLMTTQVVKLAVSAASLAAEKARIAAVKAAVNL